MFESTRTQSQIESYAKRPTTPWAKSVLLLEMLANPDFALKIFEHAYGRAPQGLYIEPELGPEVNHVVLLSDGTPVSPAVAGLSVASDPRDGKGRSDDLLPAAG